MLLLETESVNEDILAQQSDVDKKTKQLRIENLNIFIILMKETNLSAYEFDQNTSLLETEFSMVNSKKLWRSLQSLNIVNILMKETNLSVLLVGSEDFSGRGIILRDDLEEVVEKNTVFVNSDNLEKLIKSLCPCPISLL